MAGVGRFVTIPLLVFSLASAIIVLGFVARRTDISLNNATKFDRNEPVKVSKGWEGNEATDSVTSTALTAGVAVVGACIVGIHHVRVWTKESASAAQAAAWVAFGLLTLPFAFVWKEVALGGHRGDRVLIIEAFVIILTLVHFAYALLLHIPGNK